MMSDDVCKHLKATTCRPASATLPNDPCIAAEEEVEVEAEVDGDGVDDKDEDEGAADVEGATAKEEGRAPLLLLRELTLSCRNRSTEGSEKDMAPRGQVAAAGRDDATPLCSVPGTLASSTCTW